MEKIGPEGARFAASLHQQRVARDLTLRDIEERLAGIGRPIQVAALSKIERGQRRVDIDDLLALAEALEISPVVLLEAAKTPVDSSEAATPTSVLSSRTAADIPRHRIMMAVDIEGSVKRVNSVRAQLRNILFQLLDEAFTTGGVGRKHREPFIDRGDGVLCLVRPFDQVPKTLLLAVVVPALGDLLEKHAESHPELAFRLRVAVHAGEVHRDKRGPYGEDVDIVCRLVDAPELKRRLRETTGPLALAVSQEIHRAVVRHGYPGIERAAFTQAVHIRLGEERLRGWLYTPESDGLTA